jgi:hypothetical protein
MGGYFSIPSPEWADIRTWAVIGTWAVFFSIAKIKNKRLVLIP